jgi:hypothetical protein
MSESLTIECRVHFHRRDRGRKEMVACPEPPRPAPEAGRVPRVTRLLALAHRFDALLREGAVKSHAELARLGHVSPARISQIMNLLFLAPTIQEALLFGPRVQRGRDPIRLADLLPIAQIPDWKTQRLLWEALRRRRGQPPSQNAPHLPASPPDAAATP